MSTILSSDSLIGNEVKNYQGEDLGQVKDFMIDSTDGRIEYAVLDFGGFMNIGNKLFAVPMQALQLDTKEECFRINQPKERLERAEGFDKDDWPNMADPKWRANINNFYIN
ncbi:PRC-barrel domain-containing protein [Marinicella sp. S1101]|uniref:PRC-barrel domain-containing protein n=1 Tax=Marinicella marina TaxID=2996016 RepID=UPI002260FC8D|nr:PRC-barrel domain-containing protein [Marinicella marina]MCX7555180.1 PRC-barrel domain-containing protein [Marinicella marina]MDJ1140006.1 PRC-barrel domain-containing protein [Marinicella marina]